MSDQGTIQASDPRLAAVYRAVSAEMHVGRHFIEGETRIPSIVLARVVAIGAMRAALGLSWREVALRLGREPSTVFELWAQRRGDVEVRRHLAAVERALGADGLPWRSETHGAQISQEARS